MATFDLAVVGGGIVGLATAYQFTRRWPGKRVVVLEKEDRVAVHQTGHNSGVLHSGIYYKPGSLKAINCRAGKKAMEAFCAAEGIAHDICGKVIVAVTDSDLPSLQRIFERGQANGSVAPRELARLERDKQTAAAKLEQAKAREAATESALATANNLPLSGDEYDMAGDDDMAGLAGRKRFGKKFLKRAALMAFTGGAAAPFLAASRTRAGRKTFGRFLNDDGTDPMMAGDEMPVSTQVAGMGDIGSWWTRNREKVMGFGAGAASAALVASGASKGTGLNTLLTQGWDAAKGFLVPQSPGGGPAPAPVLMQMAQASIGGMDSAPGRPARSRGCKSPTLKT